MNDKEALKILNLKSSVSLEDAKKAYRILAKKYHPDVAGKNLNAQENSEARMKEINLAFRHLAPQLKSNKKSQNTNPVKPKAKQSEKPVSPQKKESGSPHTKEPEKFFWIELVKYWSNFFNGKADTMPSSNAYQNNKASSFKRKVQKNPSKFDEIFKNVHPTGIKKRKPPQTDKNNSVKSNPYNGYQKYMALKKKIKAMQPNKSSDMSVGKIQKISPITPVERIR